jgi:hypothetical protein
MIGRLGILIKLPKTVLWSKAILLLVNPREVIREVYSQYAVLNESDFNCGLFEL